MSGKTKNRLARETSPYLRQHADNPVDWYPWGPEALERARREDKPIFLSIGYSTCHWCHVMAHECFENEAIAALMNEHFINIKVDREERPDLDETYMTAVQLISGRGGWPMSVFLSPDLKPFYAGTYFPPEERGGLPSFPRLLLALSEVYREKRETVNQISNEVEARLRLLAERPGGGPDLNPATLNQAANLLKQDFDRINGGFGGAPKFPRALELGFLLTHYRATGDPEALEVVAVSLEKMARGGIYDQLGGGFHRYTVDGAWVIPHFEKMLYDNALLVPVYLAHYQISESPLSRRIAMETLNFVLREFTSPEGGFYSAWDADSEGVEGKYYIWSHQELAEILGPEAPRAAVAFGVTPQGNFAGRNVLTFPYSLEELASRLNLSGAETERLVGDFKARLWAAREKRVKPHRDEKIITALNGLMITALCLGTQVLGEDKYYQAAARAARFLLSTLRQKTRLWRIFADGRVNIPGFLDDYAGLANALVDLFETDFDPVWLETALKLAQEMEDLFLDEEDGAFFYVARDQEVALVRGKNPYDQAVPAGNSLAAWLFWRLGRYTGKERFHARWEAILRRFQSQTLAIPGGFAHYLKVATITHLPPLEITLVGVPGDLRLKELVAEAHRHFLPERRLLLKNLRDPEPLDRLIPGIQDYSLVKELPVAYVCHHYTCQPPTGDPRELAARLRALSPRRT